jgi:predicted MPP superfamily phosphohydrolase
VAWWWVIPALAVFWAVGVEPFWIRPVTYEVRLAEWPPELDGLTVVQLSDLHGRVTAFRRPWVQRWLCEADLIAVTGDLYSPTIPRRRLAAWLERLDLERLLYVSGNHDYRRRRLAIEPWRPSPAVLLDNRVVVRRRGQAVYYVAGLPDLREGRPEWGILAAVPEGPTILLTHRPDAVLHPAARCADLVLAGHTHGGQVALPGWGPILRHTRLPRRAAAGLSWPSPGQALVVSRGLGTSELPVRFWARPEVVRVVVRAGASGRETGGRQPKGPRATYARRRAGGAGIAEEEKET